THEPKIPYRETILTSAEGSYRHKKQSGGRGQFGEVHIRMFPLPRDVDPESYVAENFPHRRTHHWNAAHRFLWVDSITQGSIPNNFLPAVEKGFVERLDQGVVAGYPVEGVCVEVFYGKHHDVDSSEAAFKIAGSRVFREVFKKAQPTLLEPIVSLHVTIPVEVVGEVTGDLSSRRGRPIGMDSAGAWQTIHAEIPLAETTGYDRALSSLTGGRGEYTLELSHYEAAPHHVQQKVVQAAQHVEIDD
ncbi:MAG TPA: elongation factor G, partial [Pirellulales bacterium]